MTPKEYVDILDSLAFSFMDLEDQVGLKFLAKEQIDSPYYGYYDENGKLDGDCFYIGKKDADPKDLSQWILFRFGP